MGMTRVLFGKVEFGDLKLDNDAPAFEVAVVHRPYKMLTLDEEVAEEVAERLVAKGRYANYVIPDMYEGDVLVVWRKEDGDEPRGY